MTELFLYVFISSLLVGTSVLLYNIGVRLFHRHFSIKTRSLFLHLMLFFQPISIVIAAALKYVGVLLKHGTSVGVSYYVVKNFSVSPDMVIGHKSNDTAIDLSGVINIAAYVWLTVVFLLIIASTVKYYQFRKLLQKETVPLQGFSYPKIEIAQSKAVLSPFLIGIIRPVIIIPENGLNSAELRLAIKHEYAHYRRHDAVFKMFAEYLRIVNFFNPAFYILQEQFGNICELIADDITTTDSPVEERKTYCQMLLNLAEKKTRNQEYCLNLSKEGRLLSERLGHIMNNNKGKGAKKLTVAIACMAALSAIGVIGYTTSVIGNATSAIGNTAHNSIADTSKTVEAIAIPQQPVNEFSLLDETGNKLPESFIQGSEDYFPTSAMYSVNGSVSNEGFSVEKLAYKNGQVIVLTDDTGSGFELAKGQTVSIKIKPDYSPDYNDDEEAGELVSIGYILNGTATELETPAGRVPGKGLELSFTPNEAGTYYFYTINYSAGLQNYDKISITI